MSLTSGEPFEIPEAHRNGCCRPVTDFEKLNRVGEGTYGIVYRARDTKTNEVGDDLLRWVLVGSGGLWWALAVLSLT